VECVTKPAAGGAQKERLLRHPRGTEQPLLVNTIHQLKLLPERGARDFFAAAAAKKSLYLLLFF
jgi:hypothetical protein